MSSFVFLDESNDGHDESIDDGVVHGTIHALFSASISAMSRCIGGLNAAIRDPLNAATRDPWWLVELKAPEAQHEQLSASVDISQLIFGGHTWPEIPPPTAPVASIVFFPTLVNEASHCRTVDWVFS